MEKGCEQLESGEDIKLYQVIELGKPGVAERGVRCVQNAEFSNR